jgi:hypothetical protein
MALGAASSAAAAAGGDTGGGALAGGASTFGAGEGSGADAAVFAHAHTKPRSAQPWRRRRDSGGARIIAVEVSNRRRSWATPAAKGRASAYTAHPLRAP